MKIKSTLLSLSCVLSLSTSAVAAPYCLALRGNGEAEPAHWGALAQLVEKKGLPAAMAGGSSATISLMWLEAIGENPVVSRVDLETQKLRASLLLKSLLGFMAEVKGTKAWSSFTNLYALYQQNSSDQLTDRLTPLINAGNYRSALEVAEQAAQMGLISGEALVPLFQSLREKDGARAAFLVSEMQQSLRVFGAFNAKTDDNLFFRAGLVDFKRAARTFGRVAGFLSQQGSDQAAMSEWQKFVETCAPGSFGLSWPEIVGSKPVCAALFHEVFQKHFANEEADFRYEDQVAGRERSVFATTSLILGSSAQDVVEKMTDYQTSLDPQFGRHFHVQNARDIRFGYWGSEDLLKKIQTNLPADDAKSARFMALGSARWRDVLTFSPAEPGLAPLKILSRSPLLISAGGWSDLHPTLVLKAAGCEEIVYVTRQGGESPFAQGIAKRLFNWENDYSIFAQGRDEKDQTSDWSQLYNLANPTSSFVKSVGAADQVLCTNWNAYSVKSQLMELIEDSYRSPMLSRDQAGPAGCR